MQTTIGENDGWRQVVVSGAETNFSIDFPFFGLDDIEVRRTTVGMITTLMVRGVDYNITGTPNEDDIYPSGAVVLVASVSDGMVTISRRTSILRNSNFPLTGYLDRVALNADLNRMIVILQDFRRLQSASMRVSEVDQNQYDKLELPPLEDAPNSWLGFDASGELFYGTPVDVTGVPTSTYGRQVMSTSGASTLMTLQGFSTFFKTLVGITDAAGFRTAIGAVGSSTPFGNMPVGSVTAWAGSTLPTGTYWCDGTAKSRTTDSALFAVIGTEFGAGDGTTTFNLPDLRGRVTAGKDNMGGTAADRLTVANSGINGTDLGAYGGVSELHLSIAQLPAHDHPITSFFTSVNSGLGGNGGGSSLWYGGSSIAATAAVGSGSAVRVVQPTGIINYVIKY